MRSERSPVGRPFKLLGGQLKFAREQANQTLAEVSGAVEVDLDYMQQIEQGKERPSEEILLLLISHFDMADKEATSLWELAGYSDTSETNDLEALEAEAKKYASSSAYDVRIAYTDMVHVVANNHGVMINFMQSAGPNGQPLIVSRLGMSREHAQSVLKVLRETLDEVAVKPQPKLLAAPKPQTKVRRKTDSAK